MILSEFVITHVKGKNAIDWLYLADVTVTTESGSLWWKKRNSERRKIARKYAGFWYFVDNGCMCPGSQAEALERSYRARKALGDGANLSEMKARSMRTERDQFEAWISSPPFERTTQRFASNHIWRGDYVDTSVSIAWHAWKAASEENAKLRQELALHKLTKTSEELGGYSSQCALCWGTARKENVCDACRDSMEGQE